MNKKILVTAALPYVNNVPHLGNLMPIISADVYSRFQKLSGIKCIFVCGTDEHGTTAEIKAKEENSSPRELVDKYYNIHKKIYQWFNFEIDCFGRTSDSKNHEISKDIFIKLHKNGFLKEKTITQMWDEQAQTFLSDRYIEGICPKCGFEQAKGDQCDKCGALLEPHELLKPKSLISGTSPIEKETSHLFIDLAKIETNSELDLDLSTWKKENEKKWSKNAINTTNAWIKEGLQDRCITRDLTWGVKVPYKELELSEDYAKKVFYSWFDAPIGYISITAQSTNLYGKDMEINWIEWWKNPKETTLVQFMGKDNIPFHTILFPAFCIGARDSYTLMNEISVNEYLNYEGGKFSKSRQIGVFGNDAIDSGISVDIYRYYLIAMRPEQSDTDFNWSDFQNKVNKELIGNLGNYVNRVLTFTSKMQGIVYDSKENGDFRDCDKITLKETLGTSNAQLLFENQCEAIFKNISNFKIKEALKNIFTISGEGNYVFQAEEPWNLIKNDPAKTKKVVARLARLVKDLAILIKPIMPNTASEIFTQMNLSEAEWCKRNKLNVPLPKEHKISVNKVKPLFSKMEDDLVKNMQEKFSDKIEYVEKETFPLNLKVAKITSVSAHPDAEKLLILKVDLGNETRQIVAGLKEHYDTEELISKQVVVVSNLKPAKLRGIESQGMLLAGVDEGVVKVLEAKNSVIGEKVGLVDIENDTQEITIDELSKVSLRIKNKRVLVLGKELQTTKETIFVDLDKGKVY